MQEWVAGGGGAIVNTSSVASIIGIPGLAAYCVTKGSGLVAFLASDASAAVTDAAYTIAFGITVE